MLTRTRAASAAAMLPAWFALWFSPITFASAALPKSAIASDASTGTKSAEAAPLTSSRASVTRREPAASGTRASVRGAGAAAKRHQREADPDQQRRGREQEPLAPGPVGEQPGGRLQEQ